jgi:hypothetical protein
MGDRWVFAGRPHRSSSFLAALGGVVANRVE